MPAHGRRPRNAIAWRLVVTQRRTTGLKAYRSSQADARVGLPVSGSAERPDAAPVRPALQDQLPGQTETVQLLIAGDQDRALALWQQRQLLEVFPEIRLEMVAGPGHVA